MHIPVHDVILGDANLLHILMVVPVCVDAYCYYQICELIFQRLADVAHTLLKVAPYDPDTMRCMGLQR